MSEGFRSVTKASEIPGLRLPQGFTIVASGFGTRHGTFDCMREAFEAGEALDGLRAQEIGGIERCSRSLYILPAISLSLRNMHILEVPPAIEEKILRAVDADYADTEVIYFNRVEEYLYSALVVAANGGEVIFLEVIIDGDGIEVRELEPVLIDEEFTKEVIEKEFNVDNKDPAAAANIVTTTSTRTYQLHLTASGSDFREVLVGTRITLRDGFGREVASVVAMGDFLVNVGEAVLLVIDLSSYTTDWGWESDWFTSAATYCCRLAFVDAAGNFDGPLGCDVTMGARVGVCYWGQAHHSSWP